MPAAMRKTRAQKVQQELAGIPPSPPQALTDKSRPRRTRTPKNDTTEAHSQPHATTEPLSAASSSTTQTQTVTKPSTSNSVSKALHTTRGGRVTKKGSRRQKASSTSASAQPEAAETSDISAQPDVSAPAQVEAPETSDVSAQPDVSAQSDHSTQGIEAGAMESEHAVSALYGSLTLIIISIH